MGKKAREKRERSPNETAPGGTTVPRAAGERRAAPARAAASFEWPTWPAGEAIHWRAVWIVAGLALVVRGVALTQMTATPYLQIDNIDARGYQIWASEILAGHWIPTRHFYQSPLYAYFLAVVTAVFGPSPWPPRIIQILLGSASAGLLTIVGTETFGRRVGILAGLLLATYGPMILEEISLAKTALLIFGGLLGFHGFLRALAERRPPLMAVAGFVFGVTVIGVGQWLLALFGLVLYAAWRSDLPKPVARTLAACFLGGALVAVGPIVAWNSVEGGGVMLTSGDAGLNLYLGNNPLTTGLSGRPKGLRDVPEYEENDSKVLAERDAGHALTPAGVSRHWTRRAIGWAAQHPLDFVATTAKKITVLWNSYEIPDSYHFAFIRAQYMPWLWLGTSFAIVGPLGLLGLVLAAWHRPARPIYVVCLGYLGVIALFYVRSRYRLPAVPFLMVFAAAVLDWAVRILPKEDWRPLAALVAGLVATGVFVNHSYCEPPAQNAPAICLDGDVWFDGEWQKLAEWYERHGDLESALGYLRRAEAGESLRGPGQTALWIGRLELALAERTADAHARKTHLAAAVPALEKALRHGFHPWEAHTYLATAHRLEGRPEQALAASTAALRDRPRDPAIALAALRLHVALGRCGEARRIADDLRRLRANETEIEQLLASCHAAQD